MVDNRTEGFAWQLRVWDRMADVYQREIDMRFSPVIDQVLKLANLQPGETVLDLGTGTGAIAILAATQVGTTGRVNAIDISPEMLTRAAERLQTLQLTNVDLAEGRAEALPTDEGSVDAVIASLSLMYVIDRSSAGDSESAAPRWTVYRSSVGRSGRSGYRKIPTDRGWVCTDATGAGCRPRRPRRSV